MSDNGFDVFSADSHVIEPHDLWQIYTVEAFKDRAPRLVHEETTDRLVCDQARLPPVGLLAGCMRTDDKVRARGRWDEDVPDVGWDPEARMEALRTDGVTGEVLYPTIAMQMYPIQDVEFQWALFEAYKHLGRGVREPDPRHLRGHRAARAGGFGAGRQGDEAMPRHGAQRGDDPGDQR